MENLNDFANLLRESIIEVNTFGGIIIAFLAALIMARYNRILYFTVLALLFDQLLVPLGQRALDGGDLSNLIGETMSLLGSLEPQVVVIRFIGFFVVISLLFGLKKIFQRFGAS